MKVEMGETGMLTLSAETSVEAFALKKWCEAALVAQEDVMRGEACHWRGSMLMVRATMHPERDVGGLSVDAHDSTL